MAGRKTDAQILDEVLAQQGKVSYVDPVRSAQQALDSANALESSVNDDIRMSDQRAVNARNSLSPLSGAQKLRYGINNLLEPLKPLKPAWDIAGAAALPASLATGAPALAAGGYYALQGLYDATDPNSSMLEKGIALSGPALAAFGTGGRAVGKAMGFGDEVAAAARPVPRTFTADDIVHNGGLASTLESQPSRSHTFDMTGKGRTGYNFGPKESKVDGRLVPGNGTGNVDDVVEDALFDTAGQSRELDAVGDVDAAISYKVPRQDPNSPARVRGFNENHNPFTDQTPTLVDDVVGAADDVPYEVPSLQGLMQSIGDVPSSKAVTKRAARAAGKQSRMDKLDRMSQEHIAAFKAAQEHGVGGFTGLPQMSEAEWRRIGGNIDRITGK